MTKPEILQELYLMFDAWLLSENYTGNDAMHFHSINTTYFGFCAYLDHKYLDSSAIINELQKEAPHQRIEIEYYYKTYHHSVKDKYLSYFDIFLPRINHLKRTIKRLEIEIANTSPALI